MGTEDVYYDVMMRRLDQQLATIDTLDAKIATVFTVASAVLPVTTGLLVAEHALLDRRGVTIALIGAGVAYLGLLIVFGVSYRADDWSWRPNRCEFYKEVLDSENDEASIRFWVADECRASLDTNKPHLQRKGRLIALALVLFPIEVLFLSAAALVSLF